MLRLLLLPLLLSASLLSAQTPCENGMANGYPCHQVDLLSQVDPVSMGAVFTDGVYLNDMWGWTDPESGREYVINGMSNGTAFVDITDPLNPLVLGMLPEPIASSGGRMGSREPYEASRQQGASAWRDIKVYANHAFIVSDYNGEHGMQIFDLTELRSVENPPATFSESAHYSGISRAHNVVINEETGFAYIVGSVGTMGCNGGGLHMVDIRDPKNPVYAGCFDGDGYTHDAQVVTYHGPDEAYQGKEIAFASNKDAVTLVDVTDKSAPALIATQSYSGVQYVHQGWLTEDHAYFLSNDELDETRNGSNTRTYIWDIRDLDNPTLLGTYTAALPTIDHNLYIRDTLVYESNYTSGLRILSLGQVAAGTLSEVAYFDTYPQSNAVNYNGSWSNYPFFESGVIAVSDINNGLFLLRLHVEGAPEEPEEPEEPNGIEEEALRKALRLYPNPAKNRVYVHLKQTTQQLQAVSLHSISGREMLRLENLGGQETEIVLPSGMASGLYLLRIQTAKAMLLQKLLIE